MGQISLAILIVLLVSGTFATPRSSIKQDHPDEYPQADSYSDEKVRIYSEPISVNLLPYLWVVHYVYQQETINGLLVYVIRHVRANKQVRSACIQHYPHTGNACLFLIFFLEIMMTISRIRKCAGVPPFQVIVINIS